MDQKSPRERLEGLGIIESNIDALLVMLAADSYEMCLSIKKGLHLGAGFEQCFMPCLRPIFVQDQEVRGRIYDRLERLGVPSPEVYPYIMDMGDDPYLILRSRLSRKADIIPDWAEILISEMRQIMFEEVGAYVQGL